MHFHKSCTRNCDHHILLIMTGNVHKESCHKLLLILVREQGLYIIKTDGNGKMVVAFTITGINFLIVSLIAMWCCGFPIYIWVIEFLIWLRCWSCFRHSNKSGHYSLCIQLYKLLWSYVDFFLNLGFYYIAVEYRHKYPNTQLISIGKNPCFIVQGGPKVGIQLLKYFLYALKLHAVYFMLLVK